MTDVAEGTSFIFFLKLGINLFFFLPTHPWPPLGPSIDWKTWKSMDGCLDTNIILWEGINMRQVLPCWELEIFLLSLIYSEREM